MSYHHTAVRPRPRFPYPFDYAPASLESNACLVMSEITTAFSMSASALSPFAYPKLLWRGTANPRALQRSEHTGSSRGNTAAIRGHFAGQALVKFREGVGNGDDEAAASAEAAIGL